MEIIGVLIFFGGLLFCFIGVICGYVANNKATALQREIRQIKQRLERQELRTLEPRPEPVKKPVAPNVYNKPAPIPEEPVETRTVLPQAHIKVETTLTPDIEPSTPKEKFISPVAPPAIRSASKSSVIASPRTPLPLKEKAPKEPSAFDNWKAEWLGKFEGMNWETIIGTYILPRLGALGITIAVFIVLTLLAQKSGPGSRVLLGYGASVALIGGGFFTEKRYKDYSRVLFSAGLAMAYFVTFATHYIPLAKIFDSALPSLAGMAVIVGIWAGIAQKRKSATIAMLVTVLGHFTITLTVFSVDNVYYAGLGIVILSLGSAFFLLRNSWYYIAAVGMVLSYGNHLALLLHTKSNDTVPEFVMGMSILTVYLLIFAFAEMFAPEKLRREKIPSWFRSIFVTVNTACFFALGSLLVEGHTFTEEYHHIFRYVLATVLMGLGVVYYLRRTQDPLYNTYITKSIAMLTFGLAFQFSGNSLTTWLAIEMIVLLASAYRSGLVVTRVLAHVVALLTFVYGMYVFVAVQRTIPYSAEGYAATAIQVGFAVVSFWAFAQLYQRIDWSTRMRLGLKIPIGLQGLLWQLDLIEEAPENQSSLTKPLNGLFFPYLYTVLGIIFCVAFSLRLVEMEDRFNLFAVLAAVVLAAGWALQSRPYVIASLAFVGLTLLNSIHILIDTDFPATNILGVIALALCALATDDRFLPNRDALKRYRETVSPYILYSTVLWGLGLYCTVWFSDTRYLGALLGLSVVWAGLSLVLHSRALSFGAIVCFFATHALWHSRIAVGEVFDGKQAIDTIEFYVGLLILILGIGGERFFHWKKIPVYSALSLIAVFTVGWHLIEIEIDEAWQGLVIAGMSLAFLVYAGWSKGKTAAVLSVLSVGLASAGHLEEVYGHTSDVQILPLVAGFLACCILWGIVERLVHKVESKTLKEFKTPIQGICIAALSVLALCMLERIPALADFYLTLSWSVFGLMLFALAIGFDQKFYRYAGLCVLGLAIGRVVVVDTSELEAMHRVFAFGGLGVILLLLGLGYAKAFMQSPKEIKHEGLSENED